MRRPPKKRLPPWRLCPLGGSMIEGLSRQYRECLKAGIGVHSDSVATLRVVWVCRADCVDCPSGMAFSALAAARGAAAEKVWFAIVRRSHSLHDNLRLKREKEREADHTMLIAGMRDKGRSVNK